MSNAMQDHLDTLRELSNWWHGHPGAQPSRDLGALVGALRAAVDEIEEYRRARDSVFPSPGQEGDRSAQAARQRYETALQSLSSAVLTRINEQANLSPKEYQDWQRFLSIELRDSLDRYVEYILTPTSSPATFMLPLRR